MRLPLSILVVTLTFAGCTTVSSPVVTGKLLENGDFLVQSSTPARSFPKGMLLKAGINGQRWLFVLAVEPQQSTILVFKKNMDNDLWEHLFDIHDDKLQSVNALDDSAFLSDNVIYIDGHINPHVGVAIVVDLKKNRLVSLEVVAPDAAE